MEEATEVVAQGQIVHLEEGGISDVVVGEVVLIDKAGRTVVVCRIADPSQRVDDRVEGGIVAGDVVVDLIAGIGTQGGG